MLASCARRWALLAALVLPFGAVQFPASAAAEEPAEAAPTAPAPAKAKTSKRTKKGSKRPSTRRSKGSRKPKPRLPGSEPGKPDEAVRQSVRGEYPDHSTAEPRESPELKAMRELDKELFPPVKAPPSAPWSTSIAIDRPGPRVSANGLPPSRSMTDGTTADKQPKDGEPARDLSWLASLDKPDFPVRFEPSVVKYLEYYKNTSRGRALVTAWVKKSGRYRDAIQKVLAEHHMPKDLLWLALVESAFDPTIHSHAGAAGLWQFMPATGRIYGLTVNRRVDERLDPERSTHAAASHLKDLYQRFGTWELAFAAYNMGYGGLLASIRKYNTNDYWEIRRLEAGLPYETALYVPKIFAMAIAARNCKVFGCDTVQLDSPEPFGDTAADKVSVAPGVTLDDVAKAIDAKPETIAALNPHVIGSRLPPLEQASVPRRSWTVYVPTGEGAKASKELPSRGTPRKLATHRVRWGEPLARLAAAFDTTEEKLQALNDLHTHESPRPGTVIFVPNGYKAKTLVASDDGVVAVVPDHEFAYRDRRRVFYEPAFGDTVEDIARVCGVSSREVRRWNHLSKAARLQEGMRLQLFIPRDTKPDQVVLLEEPQVKPLTVESGTFFSHFVGSSGRKRLEITAKDGDTWRELSKRYGLSLSMLERINHKSRRSKLQAGDKVVVYARESLLPSAAEGPAAGDDDTSGETGSLEQPSLGPPSPEAPAGDQTPARAPLRPDPASPAGRGRASAPSN